MTLHLHYSAISDVGRVRRDNQDSGYAGPRVLTVCDGVGGAVRGDLASSTAVQALRKLDTADPGDDLMGLVAGAIHRADDRIGELVEQDPTLNGTSTTVTVMLFDGTTFGVGHVGDSRAYLLRDGTLRQLTHDHTFVQTLIDEGRITEEQARTHPHRNLILKALDGMRHETPDLFEVEAQVGDRVLVCSDGAAGYLPDDRLASILGSGTPDFAAVELVRASLDAGSTDNVTCVVADVREEPAPADAQPLLVGAAAALPRPPGAPQSATPFPGHGRGGDTSETPAVPGQAAPGQAAAGQTATPAAPSAAPVDPETARYAPRAPQRFVWLSRILITAIFLGVGWVAAAGAWSWSQQQFYVGEHDGKVTIFRGVNASIPVIELSHPYEVTDVDLERLSDIDAEQVRGGIEATDLDDARVTADNYAARQEAG
jgi:serine/threonine protein phosphatase PrpC